MRIAGGAVVKTADNFFRIRSGNREVIRAGDIAISVFHVTIINPMRIAKRTGKLGDRLFLQGQFRTTIRRGDRTGTFFLPEVDGVGQIGIIGCMIIENFACIDGRTAVRQRYRR